MFEYEIYYRLDDEDEMQTASQKVEAGSIEELFDRIRSIEKDHTIMSIKNLDVL